MKKFRLRKWYPSLPPSWKKGHVVTDVYKTSSSYVSEDEFKPGLVPRSEVENNPEFWEEVVGEDYEIIKISKGSHI